MLPVKEEAEVSVQIPLTSLASLGGSWEQINIKIIVSHKLAHSQEILKSKQKRLHFKNPNKKKTNVLMAVIALAYFYSLSMFCFFPKF